MLQLIENQSLRSFNTFGLEAEAAHFVEINDLTDLRQALKTGIEPRLILGGGSNLLLTKNQAGLVLKNNLKGREIKRRHAKTVLIRAGGGENWHEFVLWTLKNGFAGLENLSLIPGTVGAAPIQNIGAYGVELVDSFYKLEAIELSTGKLKEFNKNDCQFGYRDSVFKRDLSGKFFITAVYFKLVLAEFSTLNLSYGAIEDNLKKAGIDRPTPKDVSRIVIEIRESKLPNPALIGNCGSFFKNPTIEINFFEKLKADYPTIPSFPALNNKIKVPAGWLIEQCGWKGKRLGNAGCYEKQALVLVNLGGATGQEVKQLAYEIIDSVNKKFNIQLEPEVNLL